MVSSGWLKLFWESRWYWGRMIFCCSKCHTCGYLYTRRCCLCESWTGDSGITESANDKLCHTNSLWVFGFHNYHRQHCDALFATKFITSCGWVSKSWQYVSLPIPRLLEKKHESKKTDHSINNIRISCHTKKIARNISIKIQFILKLLWVTKFRV